LKNPFRKSTRRRGTGKSPEQKAREQKAKVDEFLDRSYLRYLREHPNFTEQIVMSRFDLSVGEEGTYTGGGSDDFLTRVKEVKAAADLIKGEFGEQKESGFLGLIKDLIKSDESGDIAKAIANVIGSLSQGIKPPVKQLTTREEVKKELPSPEEQEKINLQNDIEYLLSLTPKEAATIIYREKDNPQSFAPLVYEYVTNNKFDDLMTKIEGLIPPMFAATMAKTDKKWLAACFDEINNLKKQENKGKKHSKDED